MVIVVGRILTVVVEGVVTLNILNVVKITIATRETLLRQANLCHPQSLFQGKKCRRQRNKKSKVGSLMRKLLSVLSFVVILAGVTALNAQSPNCGNGCYTGYKCVATGKCCLQNSLYCAPDNCCPPGFTCYGKDNEFCIKKTSKNEITSSPTIIPAVKATRPQTPIVKGK